MALTQADFDFIRSLVQQCSAIVLEPEKVYLAETRLAPLARQEGFPTLADLVNQLRIGPANGLQAKVIEAMITHETSFFRDHYPFESLRQVVLPELVRRRAAMRSVHIWCAACSSGQEPYSVAMLLREFFPSLVGWNVRIIATDLSTRMLQRARQGRFTQMEVGRGLSPQLLSKYFHKHGPDYEINNDVKNLVEFREMNLIGPWQPLPVLDIILLRNVLIYMDVATKKMILAKVRQVLHPQGYLFLGGAETTLNLDDAFERLQFDRAGCYRLSNAVCHA